MTAGAELGHARRARLVEGGDDVEVQGIAKRAGLLGAVEDGDASARSSAGRAMKCLDGERAIEAYLDHAHLLAAGGQVFNRLDAPSRSPNP